MTDILLQHLDRFLTEKGITRDKTCIVGVSGGADSMALLHACVKLGFPVIAAHVNFGLRGEESSGDEQLVKEYCAQHSIPCETLCVTDDERERGVGSTQEWARTLRYKWFSTLLEKHRAHCILVAHHANDQTETMLLQFIRGGGGKSVYGMAEQNGSVFRPLLALTKKEILRYATAERVAWRNDASNDSDAYTRNFIRHHLMPLVEQLNPHIHQGIQQRSIFMHEEQVLVTNAVNNWLQSNLTSDNSLSIATLRSSSAAHVILWQWLNPLGFTPGQVQQIAQWCTEIGRPETAKCFSPSHAVFLRNDTIHCALQSAKDNIFLIESLPAHINNVHISLCAPHEVSFTSDNIRQYLDADKLELPIQIRPWQPGDRFHPLGAPGKQKISDFLTHAGIPLWTKERVLVLEAQGQIAAVLGYRIDDAFQITKSTSRCACVSFE